MIITIIIMKELCLLSHASTTCDRAMGGTLCNAVHKVFDTSQGIWDVIYQIHFYFLVNTNYCLLVRMLSIMNTKYSISFPFVCRLHWIFQFSRFSDLISDIKQAHYPWKLTKSKFMNIEPVSIETLKFIKECRPFILLVVSFFFNLSRFDMKQRIFVYSR